MAINLYDFHDIIRETYNEYVSRYEIDLVDFKNEYGADSEPKFIEYQRVYLSKMRDYIIENLSKIDNEDLDSQFYHDKLQEALSDNKKMFHFLNVRLNPMNYIQDQKENTSSNYLFGYFNDLNNGLVSKLDMINYLKSYNSIEEFEALLEGIEDFDKKYYADNLVYNQNKGDLTESFTTFKELVLSKIDELKNSRLSTDLKAVVSKDKFPHNIFRDYDSFIKFETYVKNHIVVFYTDFSYLKKRMEKEGFILRITDYDFAEWLSQHNYISSNDYDSFINKGKFSAKAFSVNRENNFNNIFF